MSTIAVPRLHPVDLKTIRLGDLEPDTPLDVRLPDVAGNHS